MFAMLFITAWCFSLPLLIQAQSAGIDCYDFDGSHFPNNTQCSGSQVCCNQQSDCLPNKMCIGNGQLVRPTCAIYPWSNVTCSPLCPFVTGTGVLPRIQLCPDGSYCCNNDALCCSKKAGKFIDPSGNLISNPYTTKTPGPTSAAAQATKVAATTVHATPTASSSSNGLSPAAEGVIGALAGILFLTLVAAALFVWMKRRELHNLKHDSMQTQSTMQPYHVPQYQYVGKEPLPYTPPEPPAELRNTPMRGELASELGPSRMSS